MPPAVAPSLARIAGESSGRSGGGGGAAAARLPVNTCSFILHGMSMLWVGAACDPRDGNIPAKGGRPTAMLASAGLACCCGVCSTSVVGMPRSAVPLACRAGGRTLAAGGGANARPFSCLIACLVGDTKRSGSRRGWGTAPIASPLPGAAPLVGLAAAGALCCSGGCGGSGGGGGGGPTAPATPSGSSGGGGGARASEGFWTASAGSSSSPGGSGSPLNSEDVNGGRA